MSREYCLPGSHVRLLDALARTPFAEQHELAAFTGLPPSSTLESLLGLEAGGLRPSCATRARTPRGSGDGT